MQTRRRSRNSQRGGDSSNSDLPNGAPAKNASRKRATKAQQQPTRSRSTRVASRMEREASAAATKRKEKIKKAGSTQRTGNRSRRRAQSLQARKTIARLKLEQERKNGAEEESANKYNEYGTLKLKPALQSFAKSIGLPFHFKKPRRLLDPLSAGEQCEAVISIPKKAKDKICYICREPITFLPKYNFKQEYSQVCDHVMPVIMAYIYFKILKSVKDDIPVNLKYEYRWTHILCNSQKKDLNLITMNDSNRFIPSFETCMLLLKNIQNKSGKRLAKNIPVCYDKMCKEVLNPLCSILNREDTQRLVALAGISGIYQRLEDEKDKLFKDVSKQKGKELFIKNNIKEEYHTLQMTELIAEAGMALNIEKAAAAALGAAAAGAAAGGGPDIFEQLEGLMALGTLAEKIKVEDIEGAYNTLDTFAFDDSKAVIYPGSSSSGEEGNGNDDEIFFKGKKFPPEGAAAGGRGDVYEAAHSGSQVNNANL